MKIILDAGHGYSTSGKRSPNGMREYEFNRAVAELAKEMLESYQNTVVSFAHSDVRDVPLAERTALANKQNADCYVSIHANAYGTGGWNSAGGIETYVYPSKPREALALAQKIQRNLISSTGLRDRGVKTADFQVLRETKMTAVLVECGFMTNKEEASLLRTPLYRKRCAQAIVKAIAEQYGLRKNDKIKQYKVQVAFSEKQLAEKLAGSLKRDGFNATIIE
ncbi:N-acetylmuramoyl-L-alanine amidase [Cytobacillus firmus]|uniref:N-acetylmuramoyl-L-alanine amidase n=1 Tax=Cytobacillus TaxID=2675230 RepID=UPI0020410EA0|nr:N-acetylmuramoyl-L-alanine amidase [Cytobacillus oceanisediminis]MCM3244294.1 N-acetylmuramoyl-L-alanine amidase [Cytobacillus oceanisediminis]MCS0826365.1 N-acetylmuramoyl-L-alanine amidase [Cytobacillus firmus]